VVNFLFTRALQAAKAGTLPDPLVRLGIRRLLKARLSEREQGGCEQQQQMLQEFLQMARSGPIADVPEKANEQHYEVPADFFAHVLGPHRKYSCCYWEPACKTLEQAEKSALSHTCSQAELANGQRILELGCGWGSLSLWMAEHYRGAEILAVSNSRSQKEYIDQQAQARGLTNLTVQTADMNQFQPAGKFDRVISVEMFEHMRNHELLLQRIAGWLNPGGSLYVHIFCHKSTPYLFVPEGPQDWMAEYFFSGGMMPSDELLLHYQQDLQLEQRWRWSGLHYHHTCEAWLKLQDARRQQILPILAQTYGDQQTELWFQRWRMFFLACSELFAFRNGNEWWVSHYRFRKPGA